MKLRPEVKKFAEMMEKRLSENDYKDGWETLGVGECLNSAESEIKCAPAQVLNGHKLHPALIDAANYLMFALDNKGELK